MTDKTHGDPSRSDTHPIPEVRDAHDAGDLERDLTAVNYRSPTPRDGEHLTATEATGGRKLGVMRYVLGISLAAVVVVFAGLLLVYR